VSEQERQPVLPAVERSLSTAGEQSDAGAVSMAREFARLIDEAASPKLSKALRLVSEIIDDHVSSMGPREQTRARELSEAMARIAATLAEHSVASDLGPKLVATLTALGLTPAGRGEKGGVGGTVKQLPANPLTALRDAARQRNNAAG
jgi:hypothetical protein